MNQPHPHATSTGRRQNQPQGKTARPNFNRRVHSYHNAHSQTYNSGKGPAASAKKTAREEIQLADDEDSLMAGLPQFCMTCERQVVNPGNSTLFCSRACQRRDSVKSAYIDPITSPAFTPATSYFDVAQRDILPQRSPTVLRPLSSTFSDWVPPPTASTDLEAENDSHASEPAFALTRRPHINRSSTSTLPSLSHTPSSSVGTAASASFNTYYSRPLPSRSQHSAQRSVDLVVPVFAIPGFADASVKSSASTLTSMQAAEAGAISYPKQGSAKRQSLATGSLRQLFEHEAMSSTPKGG